MDVEDERACLIWSGQKCLKSEKKFILNQF